MSKFHNPYHFVPVEKTTHGEHCLTVKQFEQRDLGDYSHAAYHQGKYSGRIVCRLTTTDNLMFIGADQKRDNDDQAATTKPFELEKGKPAIPASTLRGLLSSLAETASNSALRVLNDQVLSYRQEMRKSLSAIGMVQTEKNAANETVYKLLPLSMPILEETYNGSGLFRFFSNLDDQSERRKEVQAYENMFPEPRLKVYIGEYDNHNELNPPSLRSRETFSVGSKAVQLAVIKQTFEKDSSIIKNNEFLHIKTISSRTSEHRYLIGQKRVKPSAFSENTQGIFRILGKTGRDDIPDTKTHELLIPYPTKTEREANDWKAFSILPEAIERFEQLADDCTRLMEEKAEREGKVFEDMPPAEKERWLFSLLPYHLKGTQRNDDHETFGNKLRIKQGDLVYFRPTMQDDKPVVAEVAFSSIWRGRVEDEDGHKASVHDFFAGIDKELLPFNADRAKISPAELLFGFVENRDEEHKKHLGEKAGLAFAGRVQVSFGQVASDGSYYDKPVPLKILATPKLPCPSMYFKNRYTEAPYIKKADLKPKQHKPQGRKMYIHHRYDPNRDNPPWKTSYPHEHTKQKNQIKPVKKGTEFFFHLDFNNLSEWELGLLCYALRPTDNFRHKLGMGKPIGLGTVCIDPVGLFLIDREKRYDNDDIFTAKRYHRAWKDDKIKIPKALYPQEAQTQNLEDAPSGQLLHDLFSETMSSTIQQALKLLGDPSKVIHSVQTPLVERQLRNPEEETFRWFAENDDSRHGQHQMLKPLDEKSAELPTLNRN